MINHCHHPTIVSHMIKHCRPSSMTTSINVRCFATARWVKSSTWQWSCPTRHPSRWFGMLDGWLSCWQFMVIVHGKYTISRGNHWEMASYRDLVTVNYRDLVNHRLYERLKRHKKNGEMQWRLVEPWLRDQHFSQALNRVTGHHLPESLDLCVPPTCDSF